MPPRAWKDKPGCNDLAMRTQAVKKNLVLLKNVTKRPAGPVQYPSRWGSDDDDDDDEEDYDDGRPEMTNELERYVSSFADFRAMDQGKLSWLATRRLTVYIIAD